MNLEYASFRTKTLTRRKFVIWAIALFAVTAAILAPQYPRIAYQVAFWYHQERCLSYTMASNRIIYEGMPDKVPALSKNKDYKIFRDDNDGVWLAIDTKGQAVFRSYAEAFRFPKYAREDAWNQRAVAFMGQRSTKRGVDYLVVVTVEYYQSADPGAAYQDDPRLACLVFIPARGGRPPSEIYCQEFMLSTLRADSRKDGQISRTGHVTVFAGRADREAKWKLTVPFEALGGRGQIELTLQDPADGEVDVDWQLSEP